MTQQIPLPVAIMMNCRWRSEAVDPLTSYGHAFDQARGITPGMRTAIHWIAENTRWLKRSHIGWHAVRDGRPSPEALPAELVVELARIGMLELLDARGNKIGDWEDLASLARLVQVA